MRTRPLGKTGLDVSVLSLGGAAFGNQYGDVTQDEVTACVRRAVEAGVNFIDTSPYYGKTRAETVLGEALRGGLREEIFLCTKAGRIDYAEFDFSPAHIEQSVDASLKRLGTDHVDVLIAHDIEFAEDYSQVFDETAKCLHRLKEKGKTRFVGMSAYPLGILAQAIQVCELDVVISYCHFTLQNTRLVTELLPIAEEYGVGLLNGSPLSMGLLTEQGPPDWHPAPAAIKDAAKKATEVCRRHGATISELGMRFAFSEPRIASTITGAARVDELERNLAQLGVSPDAGLLAEVQDCFEPVKDQTWPSGNWREEQIV